MFSAGLAPGLPEKRSEADVCERACRSNESDASTVPPWEEGILTMAGKPKAPVPERRLAVTRPGSLAGSAGKPEGVGSSKKPLAQAPKR